MANSISFPILNCSLSICLLTARSKVVLLSNPSVFHPFPDPFDPDQLVPDPFVPDPFDPDQLVPDPLLEPLLGGFTLPLV